jgi:hypothetical protein
MPATYEPIATTTLGSNTKITTFSSIPSTYTDLVLVMNYGLNQPGSCFLRFNSDSGTNYSFTELRGTGSSALSSRLAPTNGYFAYNVFPDTTFGNSIVQIQNYSNTTIFKTFLSRANATSGSYPGAAATVTQWRNTSAINSISIDLDGDSNYWYLAGSTFTLYGIKAA